MRNLFRVMNVLILILLLMGCAKPPVRRSSSPSPTGSPPRTVAPSGTPAITSALPSAAASPLRTVASMSLWEMYELSAVATAREAQIPLLPPEGGIPEHIVHIARQQLQHAYFMMPSWYVTQKREYESFAFDTYANDQLSMRCYWIGEEVGSDNGGRTFRRIPMNTYVFCVTGKADGDIPALLTIELGYYPLGYAPNPAEYEIPAEDESMRKDDLYVCITTIPLSECEEDSDPWSVYYRFIDENRYNSFSITYRGRPRRADLGTIEIPFFPGAEWDIGPITEEQQAAITERKRIVQEGIEWYDERKSLGEQGPRAYTVHIPADFAMMNQYILHAYIAPESPSRPTVTFYVEYPDGYYQGYSFAPGYSKPENIRKRHWLEYKGGRPVRYGIPALEREIARGAVEEYTVVVE